ncbi:hypothetical protein EV148_10228 [Dokdonella fugitiva]|uniref:Uncharacterized protein n=2 Tax=Dokdonella fugitiva TaxID=328517 RepID=A0A4R2IDN5_9GAMM|nr:hypothetical protein EV148_10228 [Dokdonella fugitiva]
MPRGRQKLNAPRMAATGGDRLPDRNTYTASFWGMTTAMDGHDGVPTMRFFFLLSGLAFAAAGSLHAAEISVGAGPSCTTHTIADALALAAATPDVDTIRLADDQAYTGQTIFIGTSVNLVGGHAACGATAPVGTTALVGTGQWATLAIGGTAEGIHVRLEHLDISGGGLSGEIGDWGGLNIAGHAFVALADVAIHDNHNRFGGGVELRGNAIVEFERNIDVHHNYATAGGGIFADGATLRVRPHNVAVHDNDALNGGGIALFNGANVSVGSTLDDPATPVDGFLIANNTAENYGGGAMVSGSGTSLLADDTVVRDNAAAEGGGVFAGNGGYAQFARFREGPFRHCPRELECLRLSGNTAERGGAMSVRDGGAAHVDETIVRGNASASGSAFWLYGDASQLRIYSSLVVGNGCIQGASGCPTIYTSGGSLRFEHTTFADNASANTLIWGDGAQGAIVTDIKGYSSLVSGHAKIFDFLAAFPTVAYDCVLKDSGNEEVAATRSAVMPFAFQDAARGDYHLPADSVAIDWCDGAPVSSQSPDMDDTPRGLDADQQDLFGTYDLGAFEADRIFATGYEMRR